MCAPMELAEETMNDLRRYLRSIYDVCEACDAAGTTVEFMGLSPSVRQLFEIEVTAYLAYLTAADGIIEQEEVDFVNSLMSRDYSLQDCLAFVTEHDMLAEGFTTSVPVSFKLLAEFTAARGNDITDVLISFYAGLSAALASSDSRIAAAEQEASRDYLHLLRGYKALVSHEEE